METLIERARSEHAEHIANVHARALTAGYRGRVRDGMLAGPGEPASARIWRRWLARSRAVTLVALADDSVVGFCTLDLPAGDSSRRRGEIPVVAVDPDHWREGIGRALCQRVLAEAVRRGLGAVDLWVLESNEPARRFYESLGFQRLHETRTFDEYAGTRQMEIRYRAIGPPIVEAADRG